MKTLSYSQSNYLLEIYDQSAQGPVHITDVAKSLGITKPSVCRAVRRLASEGLLTHESYGPLMLTKNGISEAKRLAQKRNNVLNFLVCILGVRPETAERECCLLESMISQAAAEQMEKVLEREVVA